MNKGQYTYRVLEKFEDEKLTSEVWNELLGNGTTDVIFMTWHWQKVWWEVFGRGKLIIVVAEENNKPVLIAPLFADGGMIFFVGSGGSDYLDFIGNINEISILEEILCLAKEKVEEFLGFRLYHVPGESKTGQALTAIAKIKGWKIFDEGELPAPQLELKKFPEEALLASQKKSLVRHENWFKKNGELSIGHSKSGNDILPLLDVFFDQHINRWAQTSFPSLFLDDAQKIFYRKLSEQLSETGWLRFSWVKWNDQYIAFHFGFNYHGNFLWYKPTYEISLAKHSPGEVLIRQLLLESIKEGSDNFDFGLGDEQFKKRFSTITRIVRTWGLYIN